MIFGVYGRGHGQFGQGGLSRQSKSSSVVGRLQDETLSWDASTLSTVLHDEIANLQVKSKVFMTVLRRELTGMKVRLVLPTMYDFIDVAL